MGLLWRSAPHWHQRRFGGHRAGSGQPGVGPDHAPAPARRRFRRRLPSLCAAGRAASALAEPAVTRTVRARAAPKREGGREEREGEKEERLGEGEKEES